MRLSRIRTKWAFAVAVAFLTFQPGFAQNKSPLTAETMWQIKRLGSPSISPDGKQSVVPVTTFDAKTDRSDTDLWLVPTDGGKPTRLTAGDASDSSPAYSPDGKWIVFVSRRDSDDTTQLYLISTSGGEATRLTKIPTGAFAPKWFPDSKRVAFISSVWPDVKSSDDAAKRIRERRDSKMTARVWDQAPIRYWDRWLDDRKPHVFSISIDGGEPTAITLATGYHLTVSEPGGGSYDISPDGKEVAFSADIDRTGVDGNFDVFTVPATGGAAKNITTENGGSDGGPLYSPDGRYIAFTRQVIKGFYADKSRLVLHDRKAASNKVLTEDWDRSAGGLLWAPDSRGIYAAIEDREFGRVYFIDAASGKPRAITKDRTVNSLALSADGRTLVALRQSFSEPPTLVRVVLDSGDTQQLSRFNDELLASVALGRYESVTYKGARGDDIQMWVVYPPNFDPTKKYPLYLAIHGGPHNGVGDVFQWRWNAQVFSGWGYVTGWHNFHGSSGFGQAFTDSINPQQDELPYEDTVKAAEWFAAKPWIDKSRMGAGGGSYGGYLTSIILGRPHPFKALVAHAAVFNWYTQMGADYGASKARHGQFWEPQTDKVFRAGSPHFGAGNFNTPTLVIHGERDYRVPVNHGIELFNILQNRGIKSKLVYYPDENHWVLKPQNSLFWYKTKQEWLAQFLKP